MSDRRDRAVGRRSVGVLSDIVAQEKSRAVDRTPRAPSPAGPGGDLVTRCPRVRVQAPWQDIANNRDTEGDRRHRLGGRSYLNFFHLLNLILSGGGPDDPISHVGYGYSERKPIDNCFFKD